MDHGMITLWQELTTGGIALTALLYVMRFFRREWQGHLHRGCGRCALRRARALD